jgi:hypothetical protein
LIILTRIILNSAVSVCILIIGTVPRLADSKVFTAVWLDACSNLACAVGFVSSGWVCDSTLLQMLMCVGIHRQYDLVRPRCSWTKRASTMGNLLVNTFAGDHLLELCVPPVPSAVRNALGLSKAQIIDSERME